LRRGSRKWLGEEQIGAVRLGAGLILGAPCSTTRLVGLSHGCGMCESGAWRLDGAWVRCEGAAGRGGRGRARRGGARGCGISEGTAG
jgi:hypothetical protein